MQAVSRTPVATLALAISLASALGARAQELTTTVTAPDGVALATDVYLPLIGHGTGPWPVVLQRTPYGRSSLANFCRGFNVFGYACVGQDERGTGDSGGTYSGYLEERGDGQATLSWIAAPRNSWWSNGKVGTFGASALGMTQYSMAPGAPAALRAEIPIVATPDFYHHAIYQGGALRYGLDYSWLSRQDALGVFDQLKAHRLWGPFWTPWAVLPEVATVNVPGLHIGGWYDIFQQGTLDAFVAFQHHGGPGAIGNQRMIIGPWTHYGAGKNTAGAVTFPLNAFMYDDFISMFSNWFDRWLKGDRSAIAHWPIVKVYLMGAIGEPGAPGNRWVELDDWPPAAGPMPLFLGPGGTLSSTKPAPAEVTLTSDPANPVPTWGGNELLQDFNEDGTPGAGPHDQRPVEARSDVLVFTSEPLAAPLTVMGRVTARLWIRPDTPDLDVCVRLTDVYPDGRSMLVIDGIQRARMRCGDDRECFLTPGEPVELAVDLWSTAIVFDTGHRVRIDVSGSNYPRFEVNPNTGGDFNQPETGVIAHPVVLLGPDYPSRLILPIPGLPRPPRRTLAHE